jgi:hypothetical protein
MVDSLGVCTAVKLDYNLVQKKAEKLEKRLAELKVFVKEPSKVAKKVVLLDELLAVEKVLNWAICLGLQLEICLVELTVKH